MKLKSVSPTGAHRLRLVFSNGAEGVRDFTAMIDEGGQMVEPLGDAGFFACAYADCGAPAWPSGFDLDPSQLHREMKDAGAFETVKA